MENRKNQTDSEKEREKMARWAELGVVIILLLVLVCTVNLIDYCTPLPS